ncbi:MAG: calcium/sodium antiporter [Lachnospiraceae bacterium]
MLVYLLLILGFLLLIKGADFFVDGSSSVAKILRIPTIIIGLTVVAFGTSLPEASVSITASLLGKNDLAVSNVIGSNIFNLLFILGACAFLGNIKAKWSILKKEFPFSIIITIVLFVLLSGLSFAPMLAGEGTYTLTRIGGIVLLTLFVIFLVSTVRDALKARAEIKDVPPENDYQTLSPVKSGIYILVGLAGIVWGGDLVVNSASEIATRFGLSQTFIGLTIVALGTSLPELVTSIIAAKKGENDLAIGNVIGSNIFNILLILGVSATISPITVSVTAIYDILFLIFASILGYICTISKQLISKVEGTIFLVTYTGYFIYILMR